MGHLCLTSRVNLFFLDSLLPLAQLLLEAVVVVEPDALLVAVEAEGAVAAVRPVAVLLHAECRGNRRDVRFRVPVGPNSIEEIMLEFWLEIPCTKKMFKNGYLNINI